MKKGVKVRILISAGAVEKGTYKHATCFCKNIPPGTIGEYIEPFPVGKEIWHAISCGDVDVPLGKGQFEIIDQN